jgi:hypothetical protein
MRGWTPLPNSVDQPKFTNLMEGFHFYS